MKSMLIVVLRIPVGIALLTTFLVLAISAGDFAPPPVTASPPGIESGLLGDVDCSGSVESIDALGILQYIGGLRAGEDACAAEYVNTALADVDLNLLGFRSGNSLIDAADALQVLQDVAGLIDLNEVPVFEPTSLEEHGVDVIGNAFCIDRVDQALDLLAEKATDHHGGTVEYIGEFECVTAGSGMRAYSDPPRALLGLQTVTAGNIWLASVLVHEYGHSKLYSDYQAVHPDEPVPAVWTGQEAEALCLDLQYDALVMLDAPQWMLDYIAEVIQSDYWEVDDRWW